MNIGTAIDVAISTLSDPYSFLLLILGTVIGVVMGMLPGLGGTVTLALLIPVTFGMDPLVAFMLLVAANSGTNQGGSITAILLNTPGKAPNAATILDGFPMARDGRAGEAIGTAAVASALGAIVGIVFLVLSIPVMIEIVLLFGSAEIFWLGIWGLSVIAIVVDGNVRSGLVSAGLGLLFAMHGTNQVTGGVRWTYSIPTLLDGIKLVPALIGLFAVAEMINLVSRGESIAASETDVRVEGSRLQGAKKVIKHKWIFLRSALIGVVIGAIPGVGGTAANYVSYFQAVQTSDDPDSFGTGDVRGVIASESSNDAKDGGAFVPTLGFGIPGSSSMAILFGAFLLHGITPGPLMLQNNLDVVTIIILTAVIGNVIASIMTIGMVKPLTAVTKVDIELLAPLVIAVAFLASYALENNIFDIWITLALGILGFLMIKADMSRIPMVLGLVLGPIVEKNFFRTLQLSGGEYGAFVSSPISWTLILLTILSLFLPYVRTAVGRIRGGVA